MLSLLLLDIGAATAARGQTAGATANGAATAPLDAAHVLRPGESAERVIKGGDPVQLFRVSLEAGQCARLVVERRGVDLLVGVTPHGGGAPLRFENPAGPLGLLFVTIEADAAGEYIIEVRPVDKWAAPGRYVIRFEESHARGPLDEKRLAAARRVAEGRRLQLLEKDDSRRAALTEYSAALALWDELGDNFEAANTLHFIAQTYRALNDFNESSRHYELTLQRRGDADPQASAYTLIDYGVAQRDIKDPLAATEKFKRALELFRQTQNRRGEAAALYGIGLSYMRLQRWNEAVEHLRPARELFHAEGDRHEEARTLNVLGGAADNLLKPQEAMAYYEESLAGWEATGDLARKGNTLSGLGKLHDDFGEWRKALEYYELALANYDANEAAEGQRASTREMRASTLHNIGYTYITFGDFDKAQDYLRQSLAQRETARGRGVTRTQMAFAHVQAGEPQLALEQCQVALPLLESVKDPRQAQTLTVMGMAYEALGDYQKAMEMYRRALTIQQDPKSLDLQGQARTLTKLGDAYAALGKPDEALDKFENARRLWHSFGEREGEGLALVGAARVERRRGRLEAALKQTEAALELIEPLRSNITNRQLRASYFAAKVGYYELYIDLLMREGGGGEAQTAAAFAASERARARGLLDLLSDARVEAVAGADPSLSVLLEKRRSILLDMRTSVLRRAEAVTQGKSADVIASLDRESQKLDLARDGVEAQIKSSHPRYAALMFPKPLGKTEVQQMLDPDTLLLEFFLGEERSYVWALTPSEISGHALPPRREIEAAARRLKELLWQGKPLPNETAAARHARMADATKKYWREAPALSRTLLGPVASRLKGKRRLVVVADGELMYLPFGALPSPESAAGDAPQTSATPAPLIAQQLVVNLPSASVLSALRQPTHRTATKSVAVFADPVFEADDPRIQEARRALPPQKPNGRRDELAQAVRDTGDETKLSRLPASLQEARNIMSASPGVPHLEATSFDANREKATDPRLGDYSIVHFATHGILNEKHPELSGLVLSLYDREGRYREDGFLRLSDIYGLSLPVDLVVLSACRTGLGKEVRGEGLIGLTRGFMYAGAPRVVASLWQVDDEATAELMTQFYQKMFKEGMPPAAALRAAQLSMSKQRRWSNPYFWAGFMLQGEWR